MYTYKHISHTIILFVNCHRGKRSWTVWCARMARLHILSFIVSFLSTLNVAPARYILQSWIFHDLSNFMCSGSVRLISDTRMYDSTARFFCHSKLLPGTFLASHSFFCKFWCPSHLLLYILIKNIAKPPAIVWGSRRNPSVAYIKKWIKLNWIELAILGEF